jgi:hypothetical protein
MTSSTNLKRFTELINRLADATKISSETNTKLTALLKKVDHPSSKLIDDVIYDHPKYTKTAIQNAFRTILLSWGEDAKSVIEEAPLFILESNPPDGWGITFNQECKVLYETWKGDTYGSEELAGLDSLITELKGRFKSITETNLIKEGLANIQ